MADSLVLAFDIERSGATPNYDTIGIGASVVNSKFVEFESLFLPGLFSETRKEPTIFEERCWDEFWIKEFDKLKELTYTGDLSKKERQKEMIVEFQAFRKKWEKYANENGLEFHLACDNKVYDGGFINDMIFEHLPNTLPIPYSANTSKYNCFLETHNEQRGLLFAADPSYKKNWGFSQRIVELYDVPEPTRKHDHNPAHDACNIAFEQQVLFAIRDNRIKLRNHQHPKTHPNLV